MKDNNVVLIGYGGHAVSVISAILTMNLSIVGYVDSVKKANDSFQLKYLGNDESYLSNPNLQAGHFCAVGDNRSRQWLQTKFANKGLNFINVIHSSAFIEPSAILGKGIFIGAMAYVGGLASLADGTIINNHVNIDHETLVDKYAHVAPNASLTGRVEVGERTLIGSGSCIIPNLKIGSDVIIGAGSTVLRNIESGRTAYGNPAKELIK